MKPFKRKLILTSLITFSPALAGLFLWDHLPDQIATHFGPGNIPNGWSLPVLLTVLLLHNLSLYLPPVILFILLGYSHILIINHLSRIIH